MPTDTEIKPSEYKCDCCGGVFERGWSDEEAKKEYEEKFGMEVKEDDGVVCDDCYSQMMGKIDDGMPPDYIKKILQSYEEIGAAATRVYINEKGIIVTEVLSPDQVLELLEKINNGEQLPDNVTIQKLK